MRAILNCKPLVFEQGETMSIDYGCETTEYVANTGIGTYSYERIPAEYPLDYDGAKPGQYACYGPAMDGGDDPTSMLGAADDSIAAQQVCRRDYERRVLSCVCLEAT